MIFFFFIPQYIHLLAPTQCTLCLHQPVVWHTDYTKCKLVSLIPAATAAAIVDAAPPPSPPLSFSHSRTIPLTYFGMNMLQMEKKCKQVNPNNPSWIEDPQRSTEAHCIAFGISNLIQLAGMCLHIIFNGTYHSLFSMIIFILFFLRTFGFLFISVLLLCWRDIWSDRGSNCCCLFINCIASIRSTYVEILAFFHCSALDSLSALSTSTRLFTACMHKNL